MAQVSEYHRISFRHKRPNPLIEECLQILYRQAKRTNSKRESMLREALTSVTKYPLPLRTGAECAILKGFNMKLCAYLDRFLQNHKTCDNNNHGEPSSDDVGKNSESSAKRRKSNSDIIDGAEQDTDEIKLEAVQSSLNAGVVIENEPNRTATGSDSQINLQGSSSAQPDLQSATTQKKKSKERIYRPAYKSGAYAILVALLEHWQQCPDDPALIKEQLIDKAQKHSEESFVRPKPDTFYTAWSNITRLVTKGLVRKTRNKKVYYSLTEAGILLATELLKESENKPTVNDIIFNTPVSTASSSADQQNTAVKLDVADAESGSSQLVGSQSSTTSLVPIEMPAGSFDVILLVDKNETGGVSKKNDPTVAQFSKYTSLKLEYRSLKVGDFTWIARHKVNTDQELVLPYVVERKRMDDLGSSIKDGRFHEQKFRLRKCGIKNVIYMVENYGSNKNVGLPLQSLMQALANTRVQDGFKIHMTDSLNNSTRFLAMMTKRLTIEYKDKNLRGHDQEPVQDNLMTFQYFNKSSSKTKPLTVTETFIKLLLQLKGVSVEKALAITNMYSTPSTLMRAYSDCNQKEGEMLLANLKYGDITRNVGPKTSKSIYQLFTQRHLS